MSKHNSRCSLVDEVDNACRFAKAPYKMPWPDDVRTPANTPASRYRAGRWMMLHAVRKLGMTIGFMRPMRQQRLSAAAPHAEAFSPQPP